MSLWRVRRPCLCPPRHRPIFPCLPARRRPNRNGGAAGSRNGPPTRGNGAGQDRPSIHAGRGHPYRSSGQTRELREPDPSWPHQSFFANEISRCGRGETLHHLPESLAGACRISLLLQDHPGTQQGIGIFMVPGIPGLHISEMRQGLFVPALAGQGLAQPVLGIGRIGPGRMLFQQGLHTGHAFVQTARQYRSSPA